MQMEQMLQRFKADLEASPAKHVGAQWSETKFKQYDMKTDQLIAFSLAW